MNIFEYAMEFEKDSEEYYRKLEKQNSNPGLKKILLLLADEEDKHYKKLLELSKNKKSKLPDSQILINAVSIFTEVKKNKLKLDTQISQVELYKKAQGFEKNSENFYREKAEESTDTELKEILLHLAEQEKRHYFLLENIIQFISRPDEWIENAEFNQMSTY
jgi:rubrerythrin